MSAPDTNIERQETRHAPALLGIKGAMIFGGMMIVAVVFYAVSGTGDTGASAFEGTSTTPAVAAD